MSGLSATDGYRTYISNSPEWAAKRLGRLQHDGFRCTGCDETDRLEVHHLTYERLGHERLTDLLTLCELCHAREHGRSPVVGPLAGPTTAQITKRVRDQSRMEMAQAVLAALKRVESEMDFIYGVVSGDRTLVADPKACLKSCAVVQRGCRAVATRVADELSAGMQVAA